ncbi:hypothetical protein [Actinomadura mexicana]|uniref:Uncharacterized protein n=1 Tax=Actinomadura mexicana TaxID=134959 RepID=A0A239C280_9ACTN|nr:hypothetical protein [Actinomadura mexicana]SNS13483.1 hypothetical protein SAMN06265355_111204 [Actinomadura mexicana]
MPRDDGKPRQVRNAPPRLNTMSVSEAVASQFRARILDDYGGRRQSRAV